MISDRSWCIPVMDFAADQLGETIATLSASGLEEILFYNFPRDLSVEHTAARSIIEAVRALYAFLKREFALKQADACLGIVGDDAVNRLDAALSDTSRFGMAKTFFMAGRSAGFDMTTQEGIDAWMRAMPPMPVLRPSSLPLLRDESQRRPTTATHAKKPQRNAARKARKKSR